MKLSATLYSVVFLATLSFSSTAAAYNGAEIQSPTTDYFKPLKSYRVTWRAKPARGNCTITLFSLFNSQELFGANSSQTKWSEIAFETFGGSAASSSLKSYQTQYITATGLGPERGKQHIKEHTNQATGFNIFKKGWHNFTIEWYNVEAKNAYLVYKIDGQEVRRDYSKDIAKLSSKMNIHSGVWVSKLDHPWACTTTAARETSQAELRWIKIDRKVGNRWKKEEKFVAPVLQRQWPASQWGFKAFDGQYTPDNIKASNIRLIMQLTP